MKVLIKALPILLTIFATVATQAQGWDRDGRDRDRRDHDRDRDRDHWRRWINVGDVAFSKHDAESKCLDLRRPMRIDALQLTEIRGRTHGVSLRWVTLRNRRGDERVRQFDNVVVGRGQSVRARVRDEWASEICFVGRSSEHVGILRVEVSSSRD